MLLAHVCCNETSKYQAIRPAYRSAGLVFEKSSLVKYFSPTLNFCCLKFLTYLKHHQCFFFNQTQSVLRFIFIKIIHLNTKCKITDVRIVKKVLKIQVMTIYEHQPLLTSVRKSNWATESQSESMLFFLLFCVQIQKITDYKSEVCLSASRKSTAMRSIISIKS